MPWSGQPEGRRSGWGSIARFNRCPNQAATFIRRQSGARGHRGCLPRQPLVFNDIPEPTIVVPAPEVIEPSLIVHAFRDLDEERQILRTQVEPLLGTTKVKAAP